VIKSGNMKKIIFLTIGLVFTILMTVPKVMAAEVQVFDSTDHYLGGCQLTNKSEWALKEEVPVSKFQVWYNWNQGETELPVKLFKEGTLFAEFTATRADCDPYQHSWCNADFVINKTFPSGKYSTEIPNSRQCLKPGGTGAIRLYKIEGEAAPTSAPTVVPTIAPSPTVIEAIPTVIKAAAVTTSGTCSCNQSVVVVSAAATSGIVSLLVSLLLRKR
jgi:hypothetical protein